MILESHFVIAFVYNVQNIRETLKFLKKLILFNMTDYKQLLAPFTWDDSINSFIQ